MIIVLRPESTDAQIQHILDRIAELGFKPHVSRGELRSEDARFTGRPRKPSAPDAP